MSVANDRWLCLNTDTDSDDNASIIILIILTLSLSLTHSLTYSIYKNKT